MHRFTPILVDADEHGEVLGRFGSRYLPTVVFCDELGNKQHMVIGPKPPAEYRREVDKAIALVFGE